MPRTYATRSPNRSIQVCRAPMTLNQADRKVDGDCRISLTWLPDPRMRFKLTYSSSIPSMSDLDEGTLSLGRPQATVPVSVTGSSMRFAAGPQAQVISGDVE